MPTEQVDAYIALLPPNPLLTPFFQRYGIVYRWLAVGTISTGYIAALLAGTIINVAIPDIMGAFGIGQDDAQWLATANLASTTIAMLLSAWMVRTLGLRDTVIGAIALFLSGSLFGGLAGSTDIMIASRVLQGVAAGVLTPLSMSLIFQLFPPGKQGVATGIATMGVILAPAMGPAVGGILIDTFNWRYVFYLGIPFSLLSLLGAIYFLPGRLPQAARSPFDWTGFVLITVALTSLLVGLSHGERDGWEADGIVGAFALAVLFGGSFMWWERRCPHPLLDLTLFADRSFTIMSVNGFIFSAGLYASTYLLPLFLQLVQHLSPTLSGTLMMPAGLIMGALFPLSGRLAERSDPRLLIGGGIFCFAWSFWLLSTADAATSLLSLTWWLIIGRVGVALVMPALQMGALLSVEPQRLTQASGSYSFLRQLGGAFGVNMMSVVLERRISLQLDYLLSTQTVANASTRDAMAQLSALAHEIGYAGVDQWHAGRAFLHQLVQQQALTAAFKDSFMVLTLLFFASLLPTLALPARLRRPAP